MILELRQWKAPPILMLVLLLLQFNSMVPSSPSVQFVELFAGEGKASTELRRCGLSGSTHDINISPKYMDLCTTTFFLLFGSFLVNLCVYFEFFYQVCLFKLVGHHMVGAQPELRNKDLTPLQTLL